MTIRSLRPLRSLALAAALLGGTFLAAPAAEAARLPGAAGNVHVDVRFAGDRHDRHDRYDRDDRDSRYYRDHRRGGYGYGPGGPGYYRPRPYCPPPARIWVRGHYDRYGYWVPGHYVFVNRY